MLKNAFLINVEDPRDAAKNEATYIFGSVGRSQTGELIYGAFNVNRRTGQIKDVLYSTNQKTDTAAQSAWGQQTAGDPNTMSDTMMLSEFFNAVKYPFAHILPLDVMNRLGVRRRVTKDTQYLRYSVREDRDTEEPALTVSGDEDMRYAGELVQRLYNVTQQTGALLAGAWKGARIRSLLSIILSISSNILFRTKSVYCPIKFWYHDLQLYIGRSWHGEQHDAAQRGQSNE